jgi:hypothetical protein
MMTSGAAWHLLLARGGHAHGNLAKSPTGIANKDWPHPETPRNPNAPVGGLSTAYVKALYNGWGLLDATVVMKIYEQLAEGAGEKKKQVRKRK